MSSISKCFSFLHTNTDASLLWKKCKVENKSFILMKKNCLI